jgi:hypothetical protein
MSWADYDDDDAYFNTNQYKEYENFIKNHNTLNDNVTNEELDKYIQERENELNDDNEWKTVTVKKAKNCFSCKPRNYHKKFIIKKMKLCKFHHDLAKRPIILVSPIKHITNLSNQEPEYIGNMIKEIDSFCKLYKINHYNIHFYNNKNDEHFHFKIKCDEEKIKSIKSKSFQKNLT